MTTLLAIDTGQAACSVALWRDGAVAAHRWTPLPKGHAEALVPMIEEVQAEAAFAFEDLNAFAVTVGPGTFTGLRVGLATARGLAVAADKPLIGVTTLEAIARPVRQEAKGGAAIVASFDARRNEAYLQSFAADGASLTEPALVSLDDLAAHVPDQTLICVGTGAALVRDRLASHAHNISLASAAALPDARIVAEIAADRPANTDRMPGPLYLRAPDAKLPANPLAASPSGLL
ncbi:tRNA (adenosine(37)-N6)-threonylcarbamoyltransferase complex dimerization subunit type 1 TsaB [Parvibaculaceae bacterium PLY_AMNH_Bact1]|nr:tRNA (adenosine(37)-N6)-threonylcarbamoyltransferase complex dimerization subunit type 1 TsaB [Parvibaculaceae bacterium PLY_AMNH_Bact1]